VDDVVRVEVVEALHDLLDPAPHVEQRLALFEGAFEQTVPVAEFEDQDDVFAGLEVLVDVDQVGVLELLHNRDFEHDLALELLDGLVVLLDVRLVYVLQGLVLVGRLLAALPHLSEASFAQHTDVREIVQIHFLE